MSWVNISWICRPVAKDHADRMENPSLMIRLCILTKSSQRPVGEHTTSCAHLILRSVVQAPLLKNIKQTPLPQQMLPASLHVGGQKPRHA